MKNLILLLLLIGAGGQSFAQNQNMSGDLTKYWYYRWRMRNDFMVMGEGPGKSIVAEQRIPESHECIKWADGTIMHGYYLSMLAIEHKILSDMGRYEDLKNNERELYFAIKAFERLDGWSETIFSSENPTLYDGFHENDATLRPDVNGFFMRDDVPPDFLSYSPHAGGAYTSNFYKMNNQRTGIVYSGTEASPNFQYHAEGDYENHFKQYQSYLGGYEWNHESYLSPPYLLPPYDHGHMPIINHRLGNTLAQHGLGELSQDQVIRLILGFYTIVRSIPNQTFWIDTDNDGNDDVSMNFNEEAKRHATNVLGRAAGYVSGTITVDVDDVQFMNPASSLSPHWVTLDPREQEAWFGEYTVYMAPLRALTPSLFTTSNNLGIPNANYNNYGAAWYDAAWAAGTDGSSNNNNSHMVYLLALMSNTGLGVGNLGKRLYEKTNNRDKDALYMPFYDYLWDWNPSTNNMKDKKEGMYNKALNWISVAPCVGPHNFGPNLQVSPHQVYPGVPQLWNRSFLYDAEKDGWEDGQNENGAYPTGWFSGVDFMLLYNTVYTNLETERPMYHDLINRIVDYPINTDNSTNLTEYSAGGLLIGAFENMKVRNVITGNTAAEVKALDYIQLENGASIDPLASGSIDIYPDKLTCNAFTYNGAYKIDECSDCDFNSGLGAQLAPTINHRIASIEPEYIPTIERSPEQISGKTDDEIYVYPNPFKSEFKVVGLTPEMSFELLDIYGNKVPYSGDNESGYTLEHVATGVYYLNTITKNGEKQVIKLVKL
jgi:hypothetical protein